MRIGVDAREIQDGVVTGIGRSLANFIKHFMENEKRHDLILFGEKQIPLDCHGNVEQVIIPGKVTFFWDQILLPIALKKQRVGFYYSPYYKVPLLSNVPVVNQVLDLMYLVFPPYKDALSLFKRTYYSVFGRAYCRKSIATITDSEHAKSDIIRLWNAAPEDIAVIPLGVGDRYCPITDEAILEKVRIKFQLPEKYVLYLGNFKPHKNVEALVKAFRSVATEFSKYCLVLAGTMDKNARKIERLVAENGLMERVIFTGTITEEDRPEALLTLADLFVFPTLYEGFGLPPIEAMACGTPVVTSTLTSVPEVVGDAAITIDPRDIQMLATAMKNMLSDRNIRDHYAEKGLKRASLFSREITSGRLYNYLIKLAEDSQ